MSWLASLLTLLLVLGSSSAGAQTSAEAAASSASATPEPAPVDLNSASEAELLELPGIGPARARAIVSFREAHGGFRSVSQLMRIKGFGRAMLKRLRPLVTVSPRAAPPSAEPG